MPTTVVRSAKAWKVKSPPVKATDVGGHMVPTAKGAFGFIIPKYKRRVTLEIQGPDAELDDGVNEEKKSEFASRPSERIVDKLPDELQEDDRAYLRVWKKKGKKQRSDDSSSSSSDDGDSDSDDDDSKSLDEDGEWIEYRKYDLDEIDDVELHKHTWEATLGRAALRERREFIFSGNEGNDFNADVNGLREASKNRARRRMEEFKKKQADEAAKLADGEAKKKDDEASDTSKGEPEGGKASSILGTSPAKPSMKLESGMKILIQIMSASDLPIADMNSTDPYVTVWLGQRKVHKTKVIERNLDPVYSLEHDSTFILDCTAEEFFAAAGGLTLVVKDSDKLDANDTVAQVEIPHDKLLKMNGERAEFELKVMGKFKRPSFMPPKIAIRARKAGERDIKFLDKFYESKSFKTGVFADEASIAPHAEKVKLFKSESKLNNGIKMYRTKPTYDPDRPKDETKWLSSEYLEREMMKPSRDWIEAGSGDLGKVYIEILKMDDLPNMDVGLSKTDAFVCMLFEDAVVSTDVINDCLSPKFMPWSRRAFVLNREHPSSQIHLAVLDYDEGPGKHGQIGRISIDLTNFAPKTEYLLTYNIYKSVLDNERPVAGRITLRLRLEHDNFWKLALGGLKLPPHYYINLNKKGEFQTSYFVLNGEENLNKLDMEAIKAYVSELQEYGHLLPLIGNAIKSALLWRGHYDFKIAGKKVALPLHSMTAFVLAAMLVENYNYLPAFSLFCIAWLLLATNEYRQRHPSPWRHTLSYTEMVYGAITGRLPKVNIESMENEGAIRRREEAEAEQRKKNEEQARQAKEQAMKLSKYTTTQDTADEDEDIASPKSGGIGIDLNPMKFILLPVQNVLTTVCVGLRVISSLVKWDESLYAFFVVTACIAGGLVLMLIPWGFIIRWILRIVVWLGLGPWMKLVDIFYVRKLEEEGDNEMKKFHELAKAKAAESTNVKTQLMMKKEASNLMQSVKKYYFGKYVVASPQFKSFRYFDYPLIESQAKHMDTHMDVKPTEKKYGQHMDEDMIPKWAGEEAVYGN